jgi:hypothetical protein
MLILIFFLLNLINFVFRLMRLYILYLHLMLYWLFDKMNWILNVEIEVSLFLIIKKNCLIELNF